jgi:uncharacterized protein (DUF885 family)
MAAEATEPHRIGAVAAAVSNRGKMVGDPTSEDPMPSLQLSPVFSIADRYIDDLAALDPIAATTMGVAGHEDRLPDLSPAGAEARDELVRQTLAALAAASIESDGDRVARALMEDRLGVSRERFDAGDPLRDIRVLGSRMSSVRATFDLMRFDTDDDWSIAQRRMTAVPRALTGWITNQRLGVERGIVAAKRQAAGCAQQAATWGGDTEARPFFHALVDRYEAQPDHSDVLLRDLRAAADAATAAFSEVGIFLRDEYHSAATDRDPVGPERYAREARAYLGATIDPHETYEWGWAELARIEARARDVCDAIKPGSSWPEAVEVLENTPRYVIEGEADFQAWNQNLIDTTIAALGGTHFDIAAPLRRCQAMIAPPGGAAAMYYTPPSEDFSRPGRTWYPTLGKTRFPLWREVSICYHEGVPGHHLQIAQTVYLAESLSRYQRLLGFVSGHGEGWALYAERLMGELGYLDDPAWELGMLAAQAMRAVRVIVDIGMHLELAIPSHADYLPGTTWNAEIALPFVIERSRFPADFMKSEVDRYLGLPAQAISYKVGERVWLECRDDAQRRHGASFDLRAWHKYALDLGGLGLDALREELARF